MDNLNERGALALALEDFRRSLLDEMKMLFRSGATAVEKQWMKSAEVKQLLDISHGKLQTMRNSRVITFTKVGGTIYYSRDDIEEMFRKNTVEAKKRSTGRSW